MSSLFNDRLWHLPFNRIDKLNEQLVKGREALFFGWEFEAAARKLPDEVVNLLRPYPLGSGRPAWLLRVVPGA